MTQKELLYLEDAIGHEDSIIKICEDIGTNLEDGNLVSFIRDEIEVHSRIRTNLVNIKERC